MRYLIIVLNPNKVIIDIKPDFIHGRKQQQQKQKAKCIFSRFCDFQSKQQDCEKREATYKQGAQIAKNMDMF